LVQVGRVVWILSICESEGAGDVVCGAGWLRSSIISESEYFGIFGAEGLRVLFGWGAEKLGAAELKIWAKGSFDGLTRG